MSVRQASDDAAQLRLNPLTVASAVQRTHSREGLELLARLASRGASGLAGVLDQARTSVASGTPMPATDARALAALARAAAGWATRGVLLDETALLFRALRLLETVEPAEVGNDRAQLDRLDLQANLLAGEVAYVEQVDLAPLDDELRFQVSTQLEHPDLGRPGATWDGWLRAFNRVFGDLDGVTLLPGPGRPFDRLGPAHPPARRVGGPLVTVVMSVFRPDESLLTALRSLTAQTWTDLEILVLDDCSPEEFQPLIERAVAIDDRIVLHRMESNGGTYRIRNAAIARARGEFIAFQDSDDWAHPERIERQLRPLLDDPAVVASTSMSVRVGSDLGLVKLGFSSRRRCMVSLLFRKDPVVATLGGFDEVRKSADSEWLARLEQVFGPESSVVLDEPLVVYQLTAGSLSRQDFEAGWREHDRLAYVDAFEHWHAAIARGNASARLEPGTRPFPAPEAFVTGRREPRHHDVVLVADWSPGRPRYAGVAAEAAALVDTGLSVSMLHAEAIRFATKSRRGLSREATDLWLSGRAARGRWADPVTTDVVVVHDPELLAYPRDAGDVGLRARRVVLHAPFGPRTPAGRGRAYDPAAVEATARELFGADPVWLPASPAIAAELADEGVRSAVLPSAVLAAAPAGAAAGPWGERVVLGVTDLESLQRDRLTADELLTWLPQDDRVEVRVRDVAGALDTRTAPKPLPSQWCRVDETLEAFTGSLDVLVCPPRRTVGPEVEPAAVLAAARGAIIVVATADDPLAPAAVALDGRAVADVVRELASRPDLVEEQQRRARSWSREHTSPEAFVALVRDLRGA